MSDFLDDFVSYSESNDIAPVKQGATSQRSDTPVASPPLEETGPTASRTVKGNGAQSALIVLLTCLTFFFATSCALLLFRDHIPQVIPHVEPVEGSYVLILHDLAKRQDYTRDQIAAMDSAAVMGMIEELGASYKKVPIDQIDELKNLNEAYSIMEEQPRKSLPWVYSFHNGKIAGEAIVNENAMFDFIKRSFK